MSESKYIYTITSNSNKSSGSITSSLNRPSNLSNSVFNYINSNNKLKSSFNTRFGRFNNLYYNDKYYYKQPNFYNKDNLKSQIDILLTSLNSPKVVKAKNVINRNKKEKSSNSITTEENTLFDSQKATIDTVLPVLNTTTNTNLNKTKLNVSFNGKNLSLSNSNINKSINYINNNKQTSFSVNNKNKNNKSQNIRIVNHSKGNADYVYKCIFTDQPLFRKKKKSVLG